MESENKIDWSFLTDDFKQRVFGGGIVSQKEWLRDWRKRRKAGNLKKRMPSKKRRKQYYNRINKNYKK